MEHTINLTPISVLAVVKGQAIDELPKDLYIPPNALRVFLESFEGPLDLLLYLIKQQNLDILDLPIAKITNQYMEYIEIMEDMKLELAAEYLLMAAMLAEIKSRFLLPRPDENVEDENDPRAELIRRLLEYERFKQAAQNIDQLPREERDIFLVKAELPEMEIEKPEPDVALIDLAIVLKDVLQRAKLQEHYHIQREMLSIRERMTMVLEKVKEKEYTDFIMLFNLHEGRLGVVVTFVAILELLKQALIELVQNEPFSPIHVKAISSIENG